MSRIPTKYPDDRPDAIERRLDRIEKEEYYRSHVGELVNIEV